MNQKYCFFLHIQAIMQAFVSGTRRDSTVGRRDKNVIFSMKWPSSDTVKDSDHAGQIVKTNCTVLDRIECLLFSAKLCKKF